MTDEVKSDLARILKSQYRAGYDRGVSDGMDRARELHGAIKRDTVVVAFAIGGALGLLAGIGL